MERERSFRVNTTAEKFTDTLRAIALELGTAYRVDGSQRGLLRVVAVQTKPLVTPDGDADPELWEEVHELPCVGFFLAESAPGALRVKVQLWEVAHEPAFLHIAGELATAYPEAGLDAGTEAEANSPAVESELGSYQYWKDIHQQAEASGNVKSYLERKDISRSSYYDNVKKHGLSGVSKKAGQKPDTKPDTQPLQ